MHDLQVLNLALTLIGVGVKYLLFECKKFGMLSLRRCHVADDGVAALLMLWNVGE